SSWVITTWRRQTVLEHTAHDTRQSVHALCLSSLHVPECAEQCTRSHDQHSAPCSLHTGVPSMAHAAWPCSVQKRSAHTEHVCAHSGPTAWPCRQTTISSGRLRQQSHTMPHS